MIKNFEREEGKHVGKYTIEYNTKERGLPTLFKYQYFTINVDERKNWDYENLPHYLGKYSLKISDMVKNKYNNNELIIGILQDLDEVNAVFEVTKNSGDRYYGKKQYIKCRISKYVLKQMKKIFISTLVYDSEGIEIPAEEKIIFEFDDDNKIVWVVDLNIYEPTDNPFFKYARNAVDSLSVEAIGLNQYSFEVEKSIKDFYDRNQMTQWKEKKYLEKESEIASRAGVYMLYDKNENIFYVGTAIQLKERIIQHAKNTDDPIKNFTHYRYSAISPEYFEFLYLIENSAIHDIAWLLDMPKATKYTPSLVKKEKQINLSSCKMVNTAEHQTRKQ